MIDRGALEAAIASLLTIVAIVAAALAGYWIGRAR